MKLADIVIKECSKHKESIRVNTLEAADNSYVIKYMERKIMRNARKGIDTTRFNSKYGSKDVIKHFEDEGFVVYCNSVALIVRAIPKY